MGQHRSGRLALPFSAMRDLSSLSRGPMGRRRRVTDQMVHEPVGGIAGAGHQDHSVDGFLKKSGKQSR